MYVDEVSPDQFKLSHHSCFREELFENRASGSSPDSTKVVVLITDGDPTDLNNHTIEAYDEKHIIRFVIGVGFQILIKL